MKTFIVCLLLFVTVNAQDSSRIYFSDSSYIHWIDSDYMEISDTIDLYGPHRWYFSENPYAGIERVQISFDGERWHYAFDCNGNHLNGNDVRAAKVLRIDSDGEYRWLVYTVGECRAGAIYLIYSAYYWRALDYFGDIIMEKEK